MPKAIIIAGPNGAGKSTFAREFLIREANVATFLNTDLMAAGLSPLQVGATDVEAGRMMMHRLDHLASEGADFALETTLSGGWLAKRIPVWQAGGYRVEMSYLWLSSVEIAIDRVRRRVAEGGHDVPGEDITRRFTRSWKLFESTYRDLVDAWVVYDVSEPSRSLFQRASDDEYRSNQE